MKKGLITTVIAGVLFLFTSLCFCQEGEEKKTEETAPTEETTQVDAERQKNDTQENEQSKQSPLIVEDAVICRSVVDRSPVEVTDVLPSDVKKVCCFTRVTGATQDSEITHNWYYNGEQVASVSLFVGSKNWRTFSSKTILPEYIGDWKVEILSKDGEILKQIMFIIQ